MQHNLPSTIAVVGCGSLGTAIAQSVLEQPFQADGVNVARLIATVGTESSKTRLEHGLAQHSERFEVLLAKDNVRAAKHADVILIAVKPIKRAEVFRMPGMKEALRGKLVLSIMAGITTTELTRLVQDEGNQGPPQLVRAMPNMAAKIHESMTLFTAAPDTLTDQNFSIASWILNSFGRSQFVAEARFDISAVLVGCAGSLLLLAIDGLLDAAVAEGVKRSEAQKFVMNCAIGMMKLVPAGNHPSVLREEIASPGGCSIQALLELERRGVRSAYTDAIMKAAEKSKLMSSS